MNQKVFNFNLLAKTNLEDYYVSESNKEAYNYIINKNDFSNYSIISGPIKCGKTHLGLIWKKINKATIVNENNYNTILDFKNNIFIDDFLDNINEEYLFHIINHCYNNNLKILLTTNKYLSNIQFKYKDLSSRLKTFHFIRINDPEDDLIINLIVKLLSDKQIKINNIEIFDYILKRINRTYEDVNLLVNNIDKLSLEKKRELTIPLIRELI